MSGLEELSREELFALVAEQARVIEVLTARVVNWSAGWGRTRRIRRGDHLAADRLRRRGRPGRRGAGRRPGKQPGSPGTTLALIDDPDEVSVHQPVCCRGCSLGGLGLVRPSVQIGYKPHHPTLPNVDQRHSTFPQAVGRPGDQGPGWRCPSGATSASAGCTVTHALDHYQQCRSVRWVHSGTTRHH